MRDPVAAGAGGPAVVPGHPAPTGPRASRTAPPPGPAAKPATKPGITNPIAVRLSSADPKTFWREYFRTHEATPMDLWMNLAALRQKQQFADIQEAVWGYLTYNSKDAEPWMYEMLALTLEMGKAPPAQIDTALGYAADLAIRTRQPHDLTRVADALHLRGLDDRASALIDLAAEIDPGNPRPPIMAINLALRTKDPKRMAEAIERFLALGWPGTDASWRAEARRKVEELATMLWEDGRSAEARDLLDRLVQSESRDLFLRLSWSGDADLDLAVTEPLGTTARVLTPRTVFGGSIVANAYGKHAEEIYVCPRGFGGDYTVRIETVYNNEKDPARDVALEIVAHEGTPQEHSDTPQEHSEMRTIDLAKPAPIVVHLAGGQRTTVLPYQATAPQVITLDAPGRSRPGQSAAPSLTPSRAADALRALGATPPRRR